MAQVRGRKGSGGDKRHGCDKLKCEKYRREGRKEINKLRKAVKEEKKRLKKRNK